MRQKSNQMMMEYDAFTGQSRTEKDTVIVIKNTSCGRSSLNDIICFDPPYCFLGEITMIPKSFIPHSWRGTLPVEPHSGDIGLSFNENAGKNIIRIRIDRLSAKHLVETITEFYDAFDLKNSQSPKSSDISSSPGSTPFDGA